MGRIIDIKPFDTSFRSITNLRSYGDAERIDSSGCKVDPSADEPIERIVARCMRSGRLDLAASGCVRDVAYSDELHPEERDGFDISDLSDDVDTQQVAVSQSAAVSPASVSGDEAPAVASGAASNAVSNGSAAGAATV